MTTIHPPPSPRWQQIQDLFARACDLPPSARDVFLSQECGNDELLRKEVNELLIMDQGPEPEAAKPAPFSTITRAVSQAIVRVEREKRNDLQGKVIGSYRLTEVLGHGGAGTVYLGERADRQYSARVAVKVVANAMYNEDVMRRFQSERQILANLNHPNIARLLDAGETKQGQPFLVMEYVHGEVIDKYCDHQKLSLTKRLQLFLKVCEAVQFAHRNLVIHRDLKPGNILVTPDGTPKLLDFGIAKLLDESALAAIKAGQSINTRINDRLLTPEYASPEQILGQTVTTTSDVYTLGIVLYELVTGVRPYQVSTVSQLELERSICVVDPVKPSYMVARMMANKPLPLVGALPKDGNSNVYASPDAGDIAEVRGLSARKLKQKLNGDLDAIIMRALRKEPDRRYSSVEQLMEDIQRHLNQEPVFARQGNWAYYSGRFMRRHALGVTMSSIALAALFGFAVIMSIQAKRIAEQRDKATQESARAESVSNFLQEVFTAADPYHSQDKQVTAKELLDNAAQRINNDLTQPREVRARLLEAIGIAYASQEQLDLSVQYLQEALLLQRQMPNKNDIRIAKILDKLGRSFHEKGNFHEASQSLSEARGLLESNGLTNSSDYLQLLTDSGALEHRLSNLSSAQRFYEKGLQLSRQLHGNFHPETASMLIQLAQVLTWQSKYPEAEKFTREAVAIFRSTLPDRHPDRINADMSLGEILFHVKRFQEADELLTNGLEAQRAVFGENNFRLIDTYDTLSKLHLAKSQPDLAERDAKTELSIAISNFGKTNFNTGVATISVAYVLAKRNKFFDAEREARSALAILGKTTSPDHQYVASAEYLLGASLVGQHKAKEAEPMLRENMARWTRAEAPAWRAARTESVLGNALVQLHKYKEADDALNHSYDMLSAKDSGADADTIAVAKKRLDEFNRCHLEHRESSCQLSE